MADVLGRAEVEIHAVQASSLEAETGAIAAKAAGQVEKEVAQAGKASGAVKNAEADVKSLSDVVSARLSGALKSVGQDAGKFGQALEGGTADLESMGVSLGPIAVGAAAAAAAFVVAEKGVQAFASQGAAVLQMQRVTGATAAEASKLVVVAQTLGVSSDVLGRGMFTLSKNIETNSANLEANHVAIAKTGAGQVDLIGTLGNVADAYTHAKSATEANNVVIAAFGGRGRALIPILAEGREGIARLAEETQKLGLSFDQAGIEKAHRFEESQRQLGLAVKGAEVEIGALVVGPATQLLTFLVTAAEYSQTAGHWIAEAADKVGGLGSIVSHALGPIGAVGDAINVLGGGHKKAADAANEHGTAEGLAAGAIGDTGDAAGSTSEDLKAYAASVKAGEDASKAAAAAEQAQARAIDDVSNASIAAADSQLGYERAIAHLGTVADDVTAKQQALADAIRQHGTNSAEARKAQEELTGSIIDSKAAYLEAAARAADLAEQHAKEAGAAFDATDKAAAYKAELLRLAGTLAPDSPLRAQLTAFANDVKSLPEAKNIVITASNTNALNAINAVIARLAALPNNFQGDVPVALPQTQRRAAGGPVFPGTFIVGEDGPERLDLDSSGRGYVTPANQTRAQMQTATRTAPSVTVKVDVHTGDVHDVRTLDLIEQSVHAGVNEGLAAVVGGLLTGTGTRG